MRGAVIFDMDGVLVDSEPWWQAAQWDVFTSLGVPLTAELASEMVGRRIRDHVLHWYCAYPWPDRTPEEVEREIIDRALALILGHAAPLPGAVDAVTQLAGNGHTLALASSSPPSVISAILERLRLRPYFQVVRSAANEPFGKPHPGVYLTTSICLGVPPSACVAIEDSLNGVASAKAAGMACVAVPAAASWSDPRFGIADMVIPSLEQCDDSLISRLLSPSAGGAWSADQSRSAPPHPGP